MAKQKRKLLLSIFKYTATLGIAFFLLWYVYRDLSLAELYQHFVDINYWWIAVSIILALLSHYLRAYRWNLMLRPLGYHLRTWRTYIAVLVGYFANNLVPRLGEVTRCGVLKKNDEVPMTPAFGTVVAERAFDLLTLIVLAVFTFLIEFDRLNEFVIEKLSDKMPSSESLTNYSIIGLGIFVAFFFILYLFYRAFREQILQNALFLKAKHFARELFNGFMSIKNIENQKGFWLSSLAIWFLYYMMLIVVFYAYPPTAGLTWVAGLTLLIMSGLGMSAPVQGGIGVFHILVSSVLVLYGISPEDGKIFALVAHTTQFLTIMLFGGVSFIISVFMKQRPSYVNSK